MTFSISIIIPAYNEEHYLIPTVELILCALEKRFSDYELIIFDDGSQDKTGVIADQLALQYNKIRIIHNSGNLGVGYCYREGIVLAEKEYTLILPGDGISIFKQQDIENLLDAVGKADFVMAYISEDTRTISRLLISQNYVKVMNLLFGMRIKYFHGTNIYKSDWAKQVKKTCDGIVLVNEVVIRSIKAGLTYIEVGIPNRDQGNNSKQVRLANFIQVIKSVFKLWWNIEIVNRFSK